jgi:endonuclease YncB( thermonuclease family)
LAFSRKNAELIGRLNDRTSVIRLVSLAIILSTLLVGLLSSPADAKTNEWTIPDDAQYAEYIKSIDGDTFDANVQQENGQFREDRIRLIGIDTPETNYSYGNEPECYGKEASGRSEALLLNASEVWLSKDVSDRDKNGRLLRYVWIVSRIDNQVHFLNEDLVNDGYALAKTYRPDTQYQSVLDDAEEDAIREARGMWLECDASVSMDPTLENSETGPDTTPIDRTKTPVDDTDAVCSFFDTFADAQDFLNLYPEVSDIVDPDGDGVACEAYFQ